MSNQINDMVWDEVCLEIAQLELTLDDTHMARVDDISLEYGLHADDDRDEILNEIIEQRFRERCV